MGIRQGARQRVAEKQTTLRAEPGGGRCLPELPSALRPCLVLSWDSAPSLRQPVAPLSWSWRGLTSCHWSGELLVDGGWLPSRSPWSAGRKPPLWEAAWGSCMAGALAFARVRVHS